MSYGNLVNQFRPCTSKDLILQEYENTGPGLGASVVANFL